jgi:hypothetical protein
MLVATPFYAEMMRKAYPTIPQSPIPKMPSRLRQIIESYAWSLFQTEGTYYPGDDPRIERWLNNLADRILEEIMGTVKDVEESGRERRLSLAHHGLTQEQMRDAAKETLRELIENRLGVPLPSGTNEGVKEAKPLAPTTAPKQSDSPEPTDQSMTEIKRRSKLLEEYKEATGNIPDYQIYNAKNAGIHKPEFYDWKKGKLPRHSVTARKFEQFLREKKPPIPRKAKD